MADGQQEKQQEQTQAVAKRVPSIPMKAGVFMPTTLAETVEVAKYIAHSSLAPKQYAGDVGAVLIAMQMGAELGLTPMASLQNIAVINGRPSLWGDAMLGLVLAHEDVEDVVETFDDKTFTATCSVKRKGRSATVRTFSQEDAKTAGLWGKQGPWSQYPKRMTAMRARGFALRDGCADILRGINLAEEQQDIVITQPAPQWVDAGGEPVEGVHTFGRKKAQQQEEPPHDATTGEVKAAPEPAKQQVKAEAQAPAKAEGKKGVDW